MMTVAHTRPIDPKIGYDGTLLEAFKYLKELKIWAIKRAIKEGQVFGFLDATMIYTADNVQHKYIGTSGAYILKVGDKELLHMYPAIHNTDNTNEIECSFKYKILYRDEE